MSQGFIKFYREGGIQLLEEDPQAFLLLAQIAARARRTDGGYSRIPLKANQALIGDYKKIGLSRQQYRAAKERLTRYNLATFKPTNKGTIATLISTVIYDINAEPNSSTPQPTGSPMKTQKFEPTKNQPETIEEPVTRREESKKATTAQEAAPLYDCLRDHPGLSFAEKQSLMAYPENRVLLAIEWAARTPIKTTLIRTLHWHCRELVPPALPENSQPGMSPQEAAAWEYNQFLKEQGLIELATKNHEAIPQGRAHVISRGIQTTIILNNPLHVVIKDFKDSISEILNNMRGKGYEK